MSSHEIALSSLLDRKNNADFFKFWSASTGFLCGKKWCIEVFSNFFKITFVEKNAIWIIPPVLEGS